MNINKVKFLAKPIQEKEKDIRPSLAQKIHNEPRSYTMLTREFLIIWMSLLFCCLGSARALAQEEAIRKIEENYRRVERNILNQEYYLDEYKVNATRFSIHQPGYFQYLEKYYYNFGNPPGTSKIPLIKAIITRKEREEVIYLKKYIYDEQGQFIFYSESETRVAQAPLGEIRAYFHEEELLHWMVGDQVSSASQNLKTQASEIVSQAQHLKTKFAEHLEAIRLD